MAYVPEIGDHVRVDYLTRKKGSVYHVFKGVVEYVSKWSPVLCGEEISIRVRDGEFRVGFYHYNSLSKTWYASLINEEVEITKIEEEEN